MKQLNRKFEDYSLKDLLLIDKASQHGWTKEHDESGHSLSKQIRHDTLSALTKVVASNSYNQYALKASCIINGCDILQGHTFTLANGLNTPESKNALELQLMLIENLVRQALADIKKQLLNVH